MGINNRARDKKNQMILKQYEKIRNSISALREKIILHEFLFNGNIDDFNQLVKFEPHIAYFIQCETQQSIIIHIGRLLDGKSNVFSFKRFISGVFKSDRTKFLEYVVKLNELKNEVHQIIDWRNLIVAHENYECIFEKNALPSISNIDLVKAVEKITDFFYEIERELEKDRQNIIFDNVIMKQSIKQYIQNIKRGNAFQKLQMMKILDWDFENQLDHISFDEIKMRIENKLTNISKRILM